MSGADGADETILAGGDPLGQQESDCSDEDQKQAVHLYVIYPDAQERRVEPLNTAARNQLVRNNPDLISFSITQCLRQLANQHGFYRKEGCIVSWDTSIIPFHLEYTVKWSNAECQHLVSVRSHSLQNVAQYAKDLIPLAKSFLFKPSRYHQPHLPFTRLTAQGGDSQDLQREEARTRQTIEHAHIIISRQSTLDDMDIEPAETTARLINAGKIIPGLLAYLTSPGVRALPATDDDTIAKLDSGKQRKRRQVQGLVESSQLATTNRKLIIFPEGPLKVEPSAQHNGSQVEAVKGSIDKEDVAEHAVPSAKISFSIRRSTKKKKTKQTKGKRKTALSQAAHAKSPARGASTANESVASSDSSRDIEDLPQQPTLDKDQPFSVSAIGSVTADEPVASDPEICSEEFVRDQVPNASNTAPEELPVTEIPGPGNGTPSSDRFLAQSQEGRGSEDHITEDDPTSQAARPQGDTTLQAMTLSESFATEDSGFCDSGYSSPTTDAKKLNLRRTLGLIWAYATHTPFDLEAIHCGLWLWEKTHKYFRLRSRSCSKPFGYAAHGPVVISHGSTGTFSPFVGYDGEKVTIIPHAVSWPDIRATPGHPDFLVSCKLVEYQACELAGYYVWRHDRHVLPCRRPGCEVLIVDQNTPSAICFGCGPKTRVRYCSFQHQVEDFREHWQECGHPDLMIKCIVDHTTAPAEFSKMYPAIKEKHGFRSRYRYRQQWFAMHTYGHYTLFDPVSQHYKTLFWPKYDRHWKEMDERIERILNIALLNTCDNLIMSYLYRLLRELLYEAGEWQSYKIEVLNTQFTKEFGIRYLDPLLVGNRSPCECEWIGDAFRHPPGFSMCSLQSSHGMGPIAPMFGLKAYVERLESRYWILRAWRQQHPTEDDWRRRAAGVGFPRLSPRLKAFELGPGWSGWGGKGDDICLGRD